MTAFFVRTAVGRGSSENCRLYLPTVFYHPADKPLLSKEAGSANKLFSGFPV